MGFWTDENHMNGYGMIMKDMKKSLIGYFDNVNINTTNAKPKEPSQIRSYDVETAEIARVINFEELTNGKKW